MTAPAKPDHAGGGALTRRLALLAGALLGAALAVAICGATGWR